MGCVPIARCDHACKRLGRSKAMPAVPAMTCCKGTPPICWPQTPTTTCYTSLRAMSAEVKMLYTRTWHTGRHHFGIPKLQTLMDLM